MTTDIVITRGKETRIQWNDFGKDRSVPDEEINQEGQKVAFKTVIYMYQCLNECNRMLKYNIIPTSYVDGPMNFLLKNEGHLHEDQLPKNWF
jgi:hypothetical protein